MKSSLTDGEICLWAVAKANICSLVVLKVKFNSSFQVSLNFHEWYFFVDILCFVFPVLQDLFLVAKYSVCVCVCVCVCVKLFQSCPNLCNHMDWSLPGSSVHGILQARIMEWVSMPSSRGSFEPRDWTCISYIFCIGRRVLYHYYYLGSPSSMLRTICWFRQEKSFPSVECQQLANCRVGKPSGHLCFFPTSNQSVCADESLVIEVKCHRYLKCCLVGLDKFWVCSQKNRIYLRILKKMSWVFPHIV